MIKILIFNITLIFLLFFNNYAHALCVDVSKANLRRGPGTRYEKTWEVFKYMPFKKISDKGNWYKVKDVDGDIHWIYRKLVTDKIRCAVVKSEDAAVRSGPGTRFKKTYISPAMKYDTFRVIKIDGLWVKVVDEFTNTGWIFGDLLWIQ